MIPEIVNKAYEAACSGDDYVILPEGVELYLTDDSYLIGYKGTIYSFDKEENAMKSSNEKDWGLFEKKGV